MPFGNLSTDQALYILTTHVKLFGGRPIDTHKLDTDGQLRNSLHSCFHGVLVRNVLIFDDENTFLPTDESRAILSRVLHNMNWTYDKASAEPHGGFVSVEAVQHAIEVALFKLERASICEAKPQVFRPIKQEN